jgi:Domain of unknown function (DUF4276)
MSWRRVFALVEGVTEEKLVRSVLQPHLLAHEVLLEPIIVTTRRSASGRKTGRGGGPWKTWHQELLKLASSQVGPLVRLTTMIDLYGLPQGFPGLNELERISDTRRRVDRAEAFMAADIGDERFIPYVQRHEIEALVFVGLDRLRVLLDQRRDLQGLETLMAEVHGVEPEDIDDGRTTAPSKRLCRHIPSYRKNLHGPLVFEDVGLAMLRARCPRFHAWVSTLEAL